MFKAGDVLISKWHDEQRIQIIKVNKVNYKYKWIKHRNDKYTPNTVSIDALKEIDTNYVVDEYLTRKMKFDEEISNIINS